MIRPGACYLVIGHIHCVLPACTFRDCLIVLHERPLLGVNALAMFMKHECDPPLGNRLLFTASELMALCFETLWANEIEDAAPQHVLRGLVGHPVFGSLLS